MMGHTNFLDYYVFRKKTGRDDANIYLFNSGSNTLISHFSFVLRAVGHALLSLRKALESDHNFRLDVYHKLKLF